MINVTGAPKPDTMPEGIRRDITWSPTLDAAVTRIAVYLDARPFPPPGLHNPDGLNRSFIIGSALLHTARDLGKGIVLERLDAYTMQHAESRDGVRFRVYMQPEMISAADQISKYLAALPHPPAQALWKSKPNHNYAITIALLFCADLVATYE